MIKGVFRGQPCVLKRFAVGDARTRAQMEKEIRVLQKLRHPLIVALQAVFFDEGDSYLQLPYAPHGTLRDWMRDRLSCDQVQVVARQVGGLGRVGAHLGARSSRRWRLHTSTECATGAWVRCVGVTRCRDIKPENCLVQVSANPGLRDGCAGEAAHPHPAG